MTDERHDDFRERRRDHADLINVFIVVPDRQQQLVDLLIGATDAVMMNLPGFMSANIHRSADGTRVVNDAQWRSAADFAAMLSHPSAIPHLQQAAALAQFDPNRLRGSALSTLLTTVADDVR